MKTRNVTTIVVFGAIVFTMALGQEGRTIGETNTPTSTVQKRRSPRSSGNQELLLYVESLEIRVERLEAHLAMRDASIIDRGDGVDLDTAESEVDPRDRVLKLLRVEIIPNNPEDYDKLEELQDERDAMERTVEQLRRKVASMSGRNSGGGSYRGGSGRNVSGSRQRAAQAELLSEYRSKYRAKVGEYKKLERELKRPKQIIHGHWGNTVITLRTTKDMSSVLNRVDAGNYLTWKGRRLSYDSTFEEWIVTSISRYKINDANDP